MFKDFNKFLNEGYIFTVDKSFVSTFDKYADMDIDYNRNEYESFDSGVIKVEWKLQMEINEDGIYDFYFVPIKAVAELTLILKDHPDPEIAKSHRSMDKHNIDYDYNEDEFTVIKNYEIEAENITFEKDDSFKQLIIEDVSMDISKEKPTLICRISS